MGLADLAQKAACPTTGPEKEKQAAQLIGLDQSLNLLADLTSLLHKAADELAEKATPLLVIKDELPLTAGSVEGISPASKRAANTAMELAEVERKIKRITNNLDVG